MKKFEVLLSRVAIKELSMFGSDAGRIKERLKALSEDPYRPRPRADIKKLSATARPEFYRLRIGDYRVVYCIEDDKVKITEIFKRSRGYSWLE